MPSTPPFKGSELRFDDDVPPSFVVDGAPRDLRQTDTGDSEWSCNICGRADFKDEAGLKRHKSTIHNEKASPKPRSRSTRVKKSTLELQQDLETFFSSLGVAVMVANPKDGQIIIEGTPRLAKALANTAEKNPKLRLVLENMTAGFAYSELIAAAALILIPIAANHNMLPERFAMAAAFITAPAADIDPSQVN